MADRKLSHSEIKLWQRCRRKWWLRAYRNLEPLVEKKHGAASLGTRVHEALNVMYEAGNDAALATLDASIEADCEEYPEQAEEIRKEGDKARAMVEGYIEWAAEQGTDEDLEVISSETAVEVRMPGIEGLTLVGKMDQRVRRRSTGERLFRDYKTVDDFSRVRLLPLDTQMKHYHLLEFLTLIEETGLPPDDLEEQRTGGGLYTMLRKVKRTARAKPPFYMEETVRHNLDTLRAYYHHVAAVAAEIVWAERRLAEGMDPRSVAVPNPTRDCSWDCEFLAVCSMFDDGSDAEGMVESIYKVGDHMARYKDGS